MNADQIIPKAKRRMIANHPFHACLLFRLRMEVASVPSMATDGSAIYYNPSWVEKHTVPEIEGVIAHECMHVAYCHHLRRPKWCSLKVWNEATDYAINGTLISHGFKLPAGGLYDRKYNGWSAEAIVRDLLADQGDGGSDTQDNQTPDSGDSDASDGQSGGDSTNDSSSNDDSGVPWGAVMDATNDDGTALSEAEVAQAEREMASTVYEAAQAEKKSGKGGDSGWLRDITESYKSDELPWHQILQDALTDVIPFDETFDNPDRRFVHEGMYLPSYNTLPNGKLVFVVDTSGSLTIRELSVINGHAQDIVDLIKPTGVIVIYCDDTVKHGDEFDQYEELVFKPYGGGGTEFAPPFNYIEYHGIDPHALIYFTDGWGFVWGPQLIEQPNYPVFWVTSDTKPSFHQCAEFGEVIEVAA